MPLKNLKEFIEESRRVWKVMKKPTKEELEIMIKITLVAIVIVGAIGYAIKEAIYYILFQI